MFFFNHLRNTAKFRGYMSKQDLEKLIHAFISSTLAYSNNVGLQQCIPKKLLKTYRSFRMRQLKFQQEPRKLNTLFQFSDHCTGCQCVTELLPLIFKTLLTVFKYLKGSTYISDLLLHFEPSRSLQLAEADTLIVTWPNTKTW